MVLGNVRNTRAVVKIRKRTDVDVQPRSARVTGRDWVDGRTTTRNRGKRNVQDEVLRLEVGIELLGENRERADAPGVHVPELDCVKTERSSVLLSP